MDYTVSRVSARMRVLAGLIRGFRMAGAKRVLASLWQVDDAATRALMTKFYEVLTGDGPNADEALRLAQAYVRAQERWKHPRFWAAWVLWGAPE